MWSSDGHHRRFGDATALMMDDLNRRAASRAKHLRTEMRRESVRVVARVRPDDAPIPQSEERVTHTETVVEVTPS